ncbi:MAG: cytochrome c3 family protein [Desulfobacteraceae bacterium]|nr:cytochrome c3 family protein [Desulfobacteraceae bacterium]
MKKGIWSLGVVVLSGLMFLTVGALTASEKKPTDAPDELMIENEGYKTDKKGAVKLTHKKHSEEYKVDCLECHHVYENGKNVLKKTDPIQKCAQCHDPKKKQGKTLKLNLAYHKNCKTCHKELNKKDPNKKPPFKKCTGCHAKKK